jgi:tetratricopeptide (TPR) repeat protein
MSTAIWPSPREFWEAIQSPKICFSDPNLRGSKPAVDRLGLPLVASGGFASVFKLNSANGSRAKAVRCFRGSLGDRERRYRELSAHLAPRRDTPLARFQYVPDGMIVRGKKYPILVMDWIEGSTLDVYIDGVLKLPEAKRHLRHLADQWLHTIDALSQLGCAHGDLQHGNILVDNGAYTLVDFDGFFVPSLAGLPSIENGHLNYQHPQRRAEFFDRTLDRFSSLVIYLSLAALERQPELWQKYHDENLLFKRADFEAPGKAPLWSELKGLDAECRRLTEVLERACLAPPAASPYLLDLVSLARRSSAADASNLGAVTVRSREVGAARKAPAPRSNLGNAAPVFVPPQTRPMAPPIPSSAWTTLQMFCAGMAIAAALASFVPLFQPWILVVGVIFIAGAWPVLSRRRIVGGFTAVAGLLALMAIGTPVGWLAIWPQLNQSQSALPVRQASLAAPLTPASQTQSSVVSEKVNSQVEEHVAAAQALFQKSEFAEALRECDKALGIDPRNAQARWLRDQILKTQDMLQGKAH